MSFELPRAARDLRFTGPIRATDDPGRQGVPGTVPLARPRPVREAPPPQRQAPAPRARDGAHARGGSHAPLPWELDEDEQPTTVARSPLASDPILRDPPPHANARAARHALGPPPRAIPNFRPSAPASAPRAIPQKPRDRSKATGPSRRKRALSLGRLPLFAWVLLSILLGAISFHVAPPLVGKIGALAMAKPAPSGPATTATR